MMVEAHLLVFTFATVQATQRILEQYFGARTNGTILLDNKYFNATVTTRIIQEPEHDLLTSSEDWKRDLLHVPAVALVSADRQPAAISKCRALWKALRGGISQDAARILFTDGGGMGEKETYQLFEWGVTSQIEVVNSFLCSEDGTEVSDRLKSILECAPWPNTVHTIAEKEDTLKNSKPKSIAKAMPQDIPKADRNLLSPTRLRRGLEKKDVTKLVDELLLADDSDSDI